MNVPPGRGTCTQLLPAIDLSLASTWSTLKLGGVWRTGNSASDWIISATYICAGMKSQMWSSTQS